MYDAEKARLHEMRERFDRVSAGRSPEARRTGENYLDALTELIDAFQRGPGGDPRTAELDTTGEVGRADDLVAWAEDERRRVRRALRDIA